MNPHTACGTPRAFIDCQMESTNTEVNRGFETRIGRSVSLDNAAAMLGVSRRTIYNRIREGRLQTVRTLGGSQRVLIESVDEVRDRAAAEDRNGQRDLSENHQKALTQANWRNE